MIKKKILLIVSKFNNLGATKATIDLVKYIDKEKFDLKIVFIDYEIIRLKNSSIHSYLREIKIKYIILNKVLPSTNKLFFKLNKLIAKYFEKYLIYLKLNFFLINFNIDFVYSNRPLADKIVMFKFFNINQVIFHFSLVPSIIKNNLSNNDVNLINSSRKLLANNEENKKLYLKNGVFLNKVEVLPLSIDLNKIINDFSPEDKIITELKLNNKKIIASIGPISKRKGTDIFLKLATLCSKDNKFDKLHFIWIGYINDKEKILSDFDIPSNITIVPHTEKIYSFLKYIDCLLVCSRFEGGPIVLLESMYLEKVNISYKGCGISDELLSNDCGIQALRNEPNEYKKILEYIFIEKKIYINKKLATNKIYKNYNISDSIKLLENEFI